MTSPLSDHLHQRLAGAFHLNTLIYQVGSLQNSWLVEGVFHAFASQNDHFALIDDVVEGPKSSIEQSTLDLKAWCEYDAML